MRAIIMAFILLWAEPALGATTPCATKPGPSSMGQYWSWRQVDGKRCYYLGRRNKSRDQLAWAAAPVKPVKRVERVERIAAVETVRETPPPVVQPRPVETVRVRPPPRVVPVDVDPFLEVEHQKVYMDPFNAKLTKPLPGLRYIDTPPPYAAPKPAQALPKPPTTSPLWGWLLGMLLALGIGGIWFHHQVYYRQNWSGS